MSDSESPLRKRRRSTGGSLAKRIALENATIPICFDDQKDMVYNLPWSDLLQENELPFVNYEDLMVGIVVLAPWKHRGSGIHYSKACVVDAGYKPHSSCVSGEGPSTPADSATPKKRQSPRKPRKTGANRKLVKTAQVRSPTKKPDGKGRGHTKSVSQDTITKKASEAMDHNIFAILGNKDASDSENADFSKDGQNSNSGNGLKGGSGAGGAKSTVGAEGKGSSGAGGAKSTVGAEGQGAGGAKSMVGDEGRGSSGAGGAKSTVGDAGQGSSGASGAKSTIGAEPMELEEGGGGYSDECHYYDGHIGTETDVQTTPHTVFTRGNQDYNSMRRSFSQSPHHRSPQPQMPFQVPTPLSRRYTYPPYFHGSYSDIDWPHLSDDDISLFSQPSGVSNEHVCGMSSKDLSFVYNTWIAPLTEKLKDIEAQFQAISMGFCVPPSTLSSLNSSKVIPCSNQLLDSDSFIDQYSTSRGSSLQSISSQPLQTYTSPPELFSDNQHLPTSSRLRSSLTSPQSLPGSSHSSQAHCASHFTPGSSHSSQTLSFSQPMTESCNSSSLDQPTIKSSQRNAPSASATTGEQPAGVFIGYPEKDKHRVWVQCKKEDILAAESSAGDYNQLANALLDIVFKEELLTPDKYCCTSS